MDVKQLYNISKKIRFYLVFFCLVVFLSCGLGDKVHLEQVDYENDKAVGFTFSTEMDVEQLRVFVGEESQTSVIGVIVSDKDKHSFSPVVAFTPEQTYTLRKNNTEVLATFTIPDRQGAEAELVAMYPKLDTVPENLLKMYFEFSKPMQEVGNALDFITVTNDTDGIETRPFLRLESELWNKERTLLTLWLDPGRIKTDLIPNRERGLPLNSGKSYTLSIDDSWKSVDGLPLKRSYSKKFYVGHRDDRQPNIKEWQLRIQDEDAIKSLHIDFGEPMDAFLAKETIWIYDLNGTRIKGEFYLSENADELQFVPNDEWQDQEIDIQVESRLEDLAGNNLNHLFDTDLKKNPNQKIPKAVFSIPFEVR